MLDSLFSLCLITANSLVMSSTILIGILAINREMFSKSAYLLLFSLVLGTSLKSIWQIPLSPVVGHPGWAFPSGHMLSAVIFWGSIALSYSRIWLWVLVVISWAANMAGMIYFGYHNIYDLSAAIWCGALILSIATFLYEKIPRAQHWLIGLGLALLVAAMMWRLERYYFFHWQALGGLLGLSLGSRLAGERFPATPQIYPLVLAVGGLGMLSIFLTELPLPDYALRFSELFITTLWISYGVFKLSGCPANGQRS